MPRPEDGSLAPRAQAVFRLAEELGFALLGIAPAEPTAYAREMEAWLGAGRHGEMAYMAEHLPQRLDPRQLVPGAKSIICVADLYANRTATPESGDSPTAPAVPGGPGGPGGRIARYAWGDDYHRVMKKRLHMLADALRERWPEHTYLTTVDTAPVLEREHALRAGLGWVGKNTMLIHPALGSWLLLGEIVTTMPLQTALEGAADGAGSSGVMTDHCGTCTRCLDACPTQCITPHQIDATRCISYLTLEHRGPIDPALHGAMGDWVAGCDVCQEVCPFNQPRGAGEAAAAPQASPHAAYARRAPAPAIPLLALLNWTAKDRQKAFERSPLKRVK
ncbi:MAG: tRNA epoxyqueuosine(34) reductase QueG, partial [Planctomycetota bacterium]|nr:tRNA epoxyqueuosine(34) reductase QueG [Planctomycetota bacterium]